MGNDPWTKSILLFSVYLLTYRRYQPTSLLTCASRGRAYEILWRNAEPYSLIGAQGAHCSHLHFRSVCSQLGKVRRTVRREVTLSDRMVKEGGGGEDRGKRDGKDWSEKDSHPKPFRRDQCKRNGRFLSDTGQ